jgi:hypothetical protein
MQLRKALNTIEYQHRWQFVGLESSNISEQTSRMENVQQIKYI